jgi:hypothetical protein
MQSITCKFVALAAMLLGAAAAVADPLPSKHIATFLIHNTPGDEGTGLAWTFRVFLNPIDRDGNNVTWRITKVRIEDLNEERVWVDFDTGSFSDWIITHADPLAPADGDFVALPLVEGVAEPYSGVSEGLEYNFHTESGSAALVPHAWWWFYYQGATRSTASDKLIDLESEEDLT